MAESTYDTIKYRKSSVDDTAGAAEAGTQTPGPATSNVPKPANPARDTSGGPFGGRSNPDNQLPETAFHKMKTFFGVKD